MLKLVTPSEKAVVFMVVDQLPLFMVPSDNDKVRLLPEVPFIKVTFFIPVVASIAVIVMFKIPDLFTVLEGLTKVIFGCVLSTVVSNKVSELDCPNESLK